jgi:hypothetical protein
VGAEGGSLIKVTKNVPNKPARDRRSISAVLGRRFEGSRRGASYHKRIRRCPREHGIATVAGIYSPKPKDALDIGTLFHLALEVFYLTIAKWQVNHPKWKFVGKLKGYDSVRRQLHDDVDFLWGANDAAEKAAWDAIDVFSREPGYEDVYPVVEHCLISYFEYYRSRDRFLVIAVEQTLDYVSPIFEYSCRKDTLIIDLHETNFGLWSLEHKTAKALTEDLRVGYRTDLQILGQMFLVREMLDLSWYPPYRGCIVNIVTKQKTTAFDRVYVATSEGLLRDFVRSEECWGELEGMMEILGYPQAFGQCIGPSRYFDKCTYYDLCHNHPERSVDDWKRLPVLPEGFGRNDGTTEEEVGV